VEFLSNRPSAKVLIFARTKRSGDDLADNLSVKCLTACAVHSDRPQTTWDGLLAQFKSLRSGILVSIDVAVRDLDVNDVDIVVNSDFPVDIETYVHRIGRTGRSGKGGMAVTFSQILTLA
jgi:superfamily II DNA/RNA helicase